MYYCTPPSAAPTTFGKMSAPCASDEKLATKELKSPPQPATRAGAEKRETQKRMVARLSIGIGNEFLGGMHGTRGVALQDQRQSCLKMHCVYSPCLLSAFATQ